MEVTNNDLTTKITLSIYSDNMKVIQYQHVTHATSNLDQAFIDEYDLYLLLNKYHIGLTTRGMNIRKAIHIKKGCSAVPHTVKAIHEQMD